MAPLFYFLLCGIGLGILTALMRNEDGFGIFSDIELGVLGAVVGGMTYVLWTNDMSFTPTLFVVPAVTAMLMILGLGHFIGNQRHAPR